MDYLARKNLKSGSKTYRGPTIKKRGNNDSVESYLEAVRLLLPAFFTDKAIYIIYTGINNMKKNLL